MPEVITFEDYTPPARFDSIPWESVTIEEAPLVTGDWTQIDSISLDPLDDDPSDPALRSFTTNAGTDEGLWYRITFVDGSLNTSLPTTPIQNVAASDAQTIYADINELFRILKIRQPSDDQVVAARRDLYAAAAEIDSELDRTESFGIPYPPLVVGVNLDRAADLWRHRESMAGVTGLLGDEGALVAPARYSWARYADRLSPLKEQWGIA